MKKLSIITVTYNSSSKIEKLLKTIEKNKQYIEDVVIIENNSPDRKATKAICDSYKKVLKLEFISNKNVGFAKSCNLGAGVAKANLLLFLNPDTELQEKSLATLLDHRQKHHADLIGGKAINYENIPHGSVVRAPNLFIGLFEFSNLGKLFKISSAHKQFYYEDLRVMKSKRDLFVDAVSGAYLLITRKAFTILDGFDENIFMYLEDVDIGVRANKAGLKVMFCPHSIIWHVGGASSNNKYKIRHQAWFDSRKYYYKKHFSLLTNLLIQPIFTIEEYLLKKIKSII